MFAYADALAAHKRRHPADDVMSALVHAEIEGEKLTGEELRMFFFLLVIAGTDTTRSALPRGVLALAEHPDAYRRLRDDRALLGPAIEEMLRWHPPVLSFRRTATRDVELAGTMIRAGEGGRLPRLDPLRRRRVSRSVGLRCRPRAQPAPRLRPRPAQVPGRRTARRCPVTRRPVSAQAERKRGTRKRGSDLDRDRARVSVADLGLDHLSASKSRPDDAWSGLRVNSA
jgi:cytochrome P450